MLLDEDVQLLKAIPLFSKIEPAKLKLMVFTGKKIIFKPQETLFSRGEIGHDVMIILEGEASAILPKNKESVTITRAQPGEIIGEISVLCGTPRSLSMIAETKLVVLSLDKDLFIRLMREIPDLAIQIVHDLARRLASTLEQLDKKTESPVS